MPVSWKDTVLPQEGDQSKEAASSFLSTKTLYFDPVLEQRANSSQNGCSLNPMLTLDDDDQQQNVLQLRKSEGDQKDEEQVNDQQDNESNEIDDGFCSLDREKDNAFKLEVEVQILFQKSLEEHHQRTRVIQDKSSESAKIHRKDKITSDSFEEEHVHRLQNSSYSSQFLSSTSSSFHETGTSNMCSLVEEDISYSLESDSMTIFVSGEEGNQKQDYNKSISKCQDKLGVMQPEIHSYCTCHQNQRRQSNESGEGITSKTLKNDRHTFKTGITTKRSSSTTDCPCVLNSESQMKQQETKEETVNKETLAFQSTLELDVKGMSYSSPKEEVFLSPPSPLSMSCLGSNINSSVMITDEVKAAPRVRRKGILRPPTDFTMMMTRKTIRMKMREEEEKKADRLRKVSWGVNRTFEIVQEEEDSIEDPPTEDHDCQPQKTNAFLALIVNLLNASQNEKRGRSLQKSLQKVSPLKTCKFPSKTDFVMHDLLLTSPASSSDASFDDIFLFASLGCLFLLASVLPFIFNILSHSI